MDKYFLTILGIITFSIIFIFCIRFFASSATDARGGQSETGDMNALDSKSKEDDGDDDEDPLSHLTASDFTLLS